MSAEPIFSVVIPAFNAAATVTSAVRSVLAQTKRELEVIVINDGSTDATAEVADRIEDPRVRVISQTNRGLPAARNAGLAAARGEYIALLDSDDLLLPRYLELAEHALAGAPDAGFAYTDAYVFDGQTGRLRVRSAMARAEPPQSPPADRDGFLLALLQGNFVYVSTTIRRRLLDEVGGFNETRASSEDYELWLRILLSGYRAVRIPGRQALYRKHPGQMSGNLRTMSRSLYEVYADLPMDSMPSASHRGLLARRRRSARLQMWLVAPIAGLLPIGMLAAAKRAGLGEEWYGSVPKDVAAAFPDLSLV